MNTPAMLYLHIPFCAKKCAYCDFVSFAGCEGRQTAYVDAMIREMDARPMDQRITSVFLGGGTPSLLRAEELQRLLTAVRQRYDLTRDCEITSEANPGTVTAAWLDAAVEGGVNRLSVGVQTVQPDLLRAIGRIHDFAAVRDTFSLARHAGIANLSADLMYALPGQTLAMWIGSLETAMELQPQHLSCYALTVAEGTPFYEMQQRGELPRADEDEEMAMQAATADVLRKHGLYQYEVSNYAKPGFACRHNVGYWTRRDYIGLGCAAASLEGSVRRSNTPSLDAYIKGELLAEEETLTAQDAAFEELMLGLRMVEGTALSPYAMGLYEEKLRRLEKQGLLILREGDGGTAHRPFPTGQTWRVKLTARGFDVMNSVLTELM